MYLVVTRSFPPEVGGMQNLMWGLTDSLSKIDLTKVFADHHEKYKEFDKKASFSIERIGGLKILRKYRKAYLINDFIEKNKNNYFLIKHINTYCLIHHYYFYKHEF